MFNFGMVLIIAAVGSLVFLGGYYLFKQGVKVTDSLKVVVDKCLTHPYRVYTKDRLIGTSSYIDVNAKSIEDARFKGLLQVGYMYKVTRVERRVG